MLKFSRKLCTEAMAEHSVPFFKNACMENGLADLYEKMVTFGWKTLGKYAFSSGYVPGQIDDSAFMKGVVTRLGLTAEDPRVSGLRHLFFEAYTTSASELRRRAISIREEVKRDVHEVKTWRP